PHQRVVDGGITVRVELPHHVTDHPGALDVPALGPVTAVVHRVQDLAVNRLEAVPYVRQRPTHDHAHGVVEIRALHLDLEADRHDTATARAGDNLVRLLTGRALRICHCPSSLVSVPTGAGSLRRWGKGAQMSRNRTSLALR